MRKTTTMSPGTVPEKKDGKWRPAERLMMEPGRSRKENRKAALEKKGSEVGVNDSDGTQDGTTAQTGERPERDPRGTNREASAVTK
jgi:hypothetical protein